MSKQEKRWRLVLKNMRLTLVAFAALILLALAGCILIYHTLLRNAYDTGSALSRSYAAEESDNLAVFETLLSFGAASLDRLAAVGDEVELAEWMDLYFARLDTVLGSDMVDPYAVIDGKIIAANPWEGDTDYNIEETSWYQRAIAAHGDVVFTDVYIDAIYNRPVITLAQQCPESGAVIAFDVFPERLEPTENHLETGASVFLCDTQGVVIYQQTDLTMSTAKIKSYLGQLISRIEAGQLENYMDSVVDLDGHQRAVYYTSMNNGWYCIVTMPYANILGRLRWFIIAFVLVIIIALGILLAVTWRDERLRGRVKRVSETVQVLGNTYYALYRINYEKETYEMIKGSAYVKERIPISGAYTELLRVAGEVIEPEAFKDFMQSFSCENIRQLVHQRVRDFGGDFLRRFGEKYRWVSVRILFDESLDPAEIVLSFREVEQEKQKQLKERRLLEEALQLAQQNEEAKQAFFSNMSHDMRTPLNAIIGFTGMAQQTLSDPEKLRGYLKKIESSGHYLLQLINDVLDMSRMEQGKMVLDQRQFDLRQCVQECLDNFRVQASEGKKQLNAKFAIDNQGVIGDAFRIQQILNNLISNAIKFTGEGGSVTVSVTQQNQNGDYAQYQFIVADTGIGMSKEFLTRLYEPYAREMRFSAKQAAGTGLGMSITKSLVLQMNGEIEVESEPGQGSVFTVVLPLMIAQTGEEPAPEGQEEAGAGIEGMHVLVAEDNELNMEIVSEILTAKGVQITQAYDGQQALQQFESSRPFTYDAVLMDMQMPVMDGCEAARRIRALDRPDAALVPIIAVTANAFSEDIAATAAAGMNAHIAKPIDFETLERMLIEQAGLARKGGFQR